MNDKDEFLQLKEVEKWLGISRSQSYALLKSNSGPLPAYRVGGSIRVKKQDLENWLEDHKYETEPKDQVK